MMFLIVINGWKGSIKSLDPLLNFLILFKSVNYLLCRFFLITLLYASKMFLFYTETQKILLKMCFFIYQSM